MSSDVIKAVAEFIINYGVFDDRIEIRWHAGEPLTVKQSFYREAHNIFSHLLSNQISFCYSLQTNGLLITDAWCDLFRDLNIRVGLSIDGNRDLHNFNRVDRTGRGSFDKVMQGISTLQRNNIEFEVITVITKETIKDSASRKQFLDFIAELKPYSLGLNVEETEGRHNSSSFADDNFFDNYRVFIDELISWQKLTRINVREVDKIKNWVLSGILSVRNTQNEAFSILTIDYQGNIATFSPELLGLSHSSYETFFIGNILDNQGSSIQNSSALKKLNYDIQRGVSLCNEECDYFRFCGGGSPVNKLFENNTFFSSETSYCRANVKIITEAIISDIENQLRKCSL